VEVKKVFRNAFELRELMFGVAPETFDAVDVVAVAIRELIFGVVNAQVLLIAEVN